MGRFQSGTSRQSGLTLIELMVTLTVIGVLMAVAAPSFTRLIASNRVTSQTNEFISGLNLARAEAVRRGQSVALRSWSGTHEFGAGWKVFTDSNADGDIPSPVTAEDGTVLRDQGAAATGTNMLRVTRSGTAGSYTYTAATSQADRMYIVFNSRGGNGGGSSAFFKVCASGDSAIKGRIIQVSTVGRISVDSSAETC